MTELDALKMTDIEETHKYLAKELGFPDYYGNNLDALYDCLTEYCYDSFIVIKNSDAMKTNLGDYAKKLTKVFFDASKESEMYLILR
jgi:ribonuclease inhibitor